MAPRKTDSRFLRLRPTFDWTLETTPPALIRDQDLTVAVALFSTGLRDENRQVVGSVVPPVDDDTTMVIVEMRVFANTKFFLCSLLKWNAVNEIRYVWEIPSGFFLSSK